MYSLGIADTVMNEKESLIKNTAAVLKLGKSIVLFQDSLCEPGFELTLGIRKVEQLMNRVHICSLRGFFFFPFPQVSDTYLSITLFALAVHLFCRSRTLFPFDRDDIICIAWYRPRTCSLFSVLICLTLLHVPYMYMTSNVILKLKHARTKRRISNGYRRHFWCLVSLGPSHSWFLINQRQESIDDKYICEMDSDWADRDV